MTGAPGATGARRKAGGGAKARPGRTTTALRRARDTYIPVHAPIRRSDLHDDDNPEWTLPDLRSLHLLARKDGGQQHPRPVI